MSRAWRSTGWRALLPVIAVAALSPAASEAAPLEVPARAPAPRFRAETAGASSLRVADAAEAGARTNGKIVAFDHGSRPFGTYSVKTVYVMPQWRRWGNPDFDLAALRVEPNRLGALTAVVGGRGFTASQSRHSTFRIFGYPAAALRGEELRSCRAHGLGIDPLTNRFFGPPTMPASCDMAAGASGGAWIRRGEFVNGVTSYSYAGHPTRLHSPYFGPQIAAFLRRLP